MSHVSHRNSTSPSATFHGLPTGSGIGIIFAALFTGVLLSLSTAVIGWPFLALYAAAVIVVATLVNPRGLFLTVASAPILFVVAVVIAGWVMSRNQIAAGGASGKAALLLVFYPVIELFPVLFAVTLGSIVIAVVRIRLIKRHNEQLLRRETAERTRINRSNRRTNSEGRRARERAKAVSVDELLRRADSERSAKRAQKPAQKPAQKKSPRSGSTSIADRLGEDLYKG
ncbi:DUF6542 domain-containing protein [Corynebacterium sp. MSK008]|uniref:DUF6542 domain-containing protein n=1 Tax=Corynebacterium sp. MSK008 TaxID=3050188 RepID=UPI00254E1990|nr:DUF6542 domain-containing protein [Corynebacterium sp. MSK008]MDK8878942.1 hypothetical protein [Corynebacterium sp. MSK008]